MDIDWVLDFLAVARLGNFSKAAEARDVAQSTLSRRVQALEEWAGSPLSYSSGGSGTTHHLSGALFGHMAGIDMLHVPYRGAAARVIAVIAGEVDIGFLNSPSVLPFIKDGKLRALGVTSPGRLDFLPDVASMDEHGLKGYQIDVWFGIAAPAGTPADVVERVRLAVDAAVQDPEVQKKLDPQGARIMKRMDSAEFSGFVKDEIDRWSSIVKISGATVQ